MKIARGRELLTPEQRQSFMQIPEDEWILGTYFTFSKRDLEIVCRDLVGDLCRAHLVQSRGLVYEDSGGL